MYGRMHSVKRVLVNRGFLLTELLLTKFTVPQMVAEGLWTFQAYQFPLLLLETPPEENQCAVVDAMMLLHVLCI